MAGLVHSLIAASAFVPAPRLLRIVRFAIVGAVATLSYACLTMVLARMIDAPLALLSLGASLASTPVSFFGHRLWTFSSQGSAWSQFPRFIGLNGFNYALSVVIPLLFHDLGGLGAKVAITASCVLIPCFNFLCMEQLVFRRIRA